MVAPLLPEQSFRFIYLDPPFVTGRERVGSDSRYRFSDTWKGELEEFIPWLRERIKLMIPLLVANGSLVLHLDWRAAHYARVMLDELFGISGFMNEIIWHYTGGGRSKNRFSCKHDTLLWYAKGPEPLFNIDAIRVPYKESSGYARSGIIAASGKKYEPNPKGTPVDDVWDIPIINPMSRERVGYPTQKPSALLNRLVSALSAKGELVGDFFCGSGTTLAVAEDLGRNWIGADISCEAIRCVQERLADMSTVPVEEIATRV